MAFEKSWHAKSYVAASVVNAGQPVALLGTLSPGSALNEVVVPAGSYNVNPIGVARATVATPGMPVDVDLGGFVKVLSAASIGAGALIVVGSTNGVVIQLQPSGLSTALGSAVGAAGLRYSLGVAESNALAADIFTIRLNPQQIV